MSRDKDAGRGFYEQAKAVSDDKKQCLSLMRKAYACDPRDKYMNIISSLKQAVGTSDESGSGSDSDSSGNVIILSAQKSKNASEAKATHDQSVESLSHAVASVSVADAEKPGKPSKFTKVEGIRILTSVYSRLYGYQIEGLKFLLRLFNDEKHGCILADDMGLGKTIQTIVLLSSLMDSDKVKSVLIVAPSTLLVNWGKEFKKWYPHIDLYSYHEGILDKKLRNLRTVQRRGGVLFTTFGLLQNHVQYLRSFDNKDFVWDFVVLDEAHKIKNPTKTTRAVSEIPSYFNLAITGTPVQNNLRELWTIYNWVMRGELLGGYSQFKERYEIPITNARKKDASDRQKKNGTLLAEDLRNQYAPYFLRRTKDQVMGKRMSLSGGSGLQALPPKYDWVVWITLTEEQISMYQQYLQSKGVKAAMREKKNVLTKLVDLKKICDSPFLLSRNVIKTLDAMNRRKAKDLNSSRYDALLDEDDEELVSIDDLEVETLMSNTAKLIFLIQLLENLRKNGHRTLVFSQSTRMLDIIQKVLQERDFQMARLDGRVKNKDRDKIITTFQESDTIDVCLLSTGVGSVGLTLTNADRVVIYDPSWNPGSDAQAIDRAYRIGQTKPVLVYRLITCSTVEEKIFIRQVFKNSVIKQMVQSEQDPTRYFADQDIRELLKFEDPFRCKTCHQIEEMHGHQMTPCPLTDSHREEVAQIPNCYKVSDHDLLFSITPEEIILDDDEEQQVITNVQQTRQKLGSEIEDIKTNQAGRWTREFELHVATGGARDRPPDHDNMANPTPLDQGIIVETGNESDIFDGPTIPIDDSDLSPMSPLHKRADGGDDEAIDFDHLSSDDEAAGPNVSDHEADESAHAMEHNYSYPILKSPRLSANNDRDADDRPSSGHHSANQTANDSDINVRRGGRKLRVIDSDSECSSKSESISANDHEDVGTDEGSDASSGSPHPFQSDPTNLNAGDVPDQQPASSKLEDDGLLSDDSRTSSDFLDDVASPANFKSLASKFHSTAVNFDPMNSPAAAVSPHLSPVSAGTSNQLNKSVYFTPGAPQLHAVPDSADQTIIISDLLSDDEERTSPVLDESFSPSEKVADQLSLHLSRLSIPSFNQTNHALDTFVRKTSGVVDDSPCHSSDGSSSPVVDSSSPMNFPMRPSVFQSPSLLPVDVSDSRSLNSEAGVADQGSHHLAENPDPDDRCASPIFGENDSILLQSPCSMESPSRDFSSVANTSHVTLRKKRTKSRLGNGSTASVACALDYGEDDE